MTIEDFIRATLDDETRRIDADFLAAAAEKLARRLDDESRAWEEVNPVLRPVLKFISQGGGVPPSVVRNWAGQRGLLVMPMVAGGTEPSVGQAIPIPASRIGGCEEVYWRIPEVKEAAALSCLTNPSLVDSGGVRLESGQVRVAPSLLPEQWNLFSLDDDGDYTASTLFALKRVDKSNTTDRSYEDIIGLITRGRLWEAWAAVIEAHPDTTHRESLALMIWSQTALLLDEASTALAESSQYEQTDIKDAMLALAQIPEELDGLKQSIIQTRIRESQKE